MKIIIAMLLSLWAAVAYAQSDEILVSHVNPGVYQLTVYKTSSGDKYLRYEGVYTNMTGAVMATTISLHADIKYIELDSTGGSLYEIDAPARKIRDLKIPVVVREGEICASACAYMAMASPDIRIEGLFAFHLPYDDEYTKETTLYDISQASVGVTLLMTRDFFDNGWLLYLYYLVERNTGIDSWLVFSDSEKLNNYRFSDPAEFMDEPRVPGGFEILTTQEISVRLAN